MRASTPSPHVGDDEHAVDMPLIAKDGQHHVLDPNAKPSCQVRWRVALLALMCFQILVGAGVVYGWPALESTMIEVGVYAEACDRDSSAVAQPSMTASIACHKQLLKLNTIYVAASWGCQASGLLGFVLDKVGVRVTVVGSSLALALGSAAFAMSSGANPWFDLYLPGLTLMGVAGSGIYLSAQGLGNLFPAATRRMALFAITGVFAPSMLVFLAFHILVVSEGLITLRSAFLLYAAFQLGLAVVSLVVWPNKFDEILIEEDVDDADAALLDNKQCDGDASTTKTVTYGSSATPKPAPATPASPTSSEYRAPTPQSRHDAEDATGNGGGEGYVPESQHRSPPDRSQVSFGTVRTMGKEESVVSLSPSLVSPPSFLDQLRDIRFILQVVVFSVMLLPAQFYIGNIGSQVGRIADSRSTVSDYSRYFNLVYSFASLATPALGLLTDRVGFAGTYLVVTALYIGSFAIITWVHDLPWWFASFVVYTLARNGQFSLFVSYLAKEFGPTHLGKLIGIGFLSSAMVSILQAPLLDLVLGPLNGNFTWGNIILMASLLLMTPYALFLGRLCCARKQALLRRASRASRRSLRTPDLSAHKMPPSTAAHPAVASQ